MLQQLEVLDLSTDGRYATDAELTFLREYLQTAATRIRAYQKIQAAETEIIKQVRAQMMATDPNLLHQDGTDLSAKWQRDTVRVMRYAALALLTDDTELFKERLLMWFSTVMGAFRAEKSCHATYTIMLQVIQKYLTAEETALFLPVWRLCRDVVGRID